jgi:hypothetical protein
VRRQGEGRWPGPGSPQGDFLKAVFDEFADPRAAIDMWDDFEQEIRLLEGGFD